MRCMLDRSIDSHLKLDIVSEDLSLQLKFSKLRKSVYLALFLGWQDVRQAYRRSALGPFWITAAMLVQIASMGLVFGIIFKSPMNEYLPFLATSIISWGFLSSVIVDGCMSFINAESVIKQLPLPLFVHVLRIVAKQFITFGHNFIILPVVFIIFSHKVGWELTLFLPGLVLATLNIGCIAFLAAILSARFRDIPQVVSATMTIIYFISPVMWQPSLIPAGTAHLLLGLNPFYHLLQIVRLPLLGKVPTIENWTISAAAALVGILVVAKVMNKYRKKIAYWV